MRHLKSLLCLFVLLTLFAGCQVKEFEQLKTAESSEDEKAAFSAIAKNHDDYTVELVRKDGSAISADDMEQELEDDNVIVKITLLGGKTISHRLIDKENLDFLE